MEPSTSSSFSSSSSKMPRKSSNSGPKKQAPKKSDPKPSTSSAQTLAQVAKLRTPSAEAMAKNSRLALAVARSLRENAMFNVGSIDEPVVHNVVATANLCCRLDLRTIVIRVRNAEYNPQRFKAVIMRILEPRTTAMIFASGKMVCTGAKSERNACIAVRKFARIIQKLGFEVKLTEFKIQNIVSTIDCKFPIRVDKLAQVHAQFCTYDPDFFPALVYRMVRPSTVLLVFVSGKVIITAAKSRAETKDTIEHLGPVFYAFRK